MKVSESECGGSKRSKITQKRATIELAEWRSPGLREERKRGGEERGGGREKGQLRSDGRTIINDGSRVPRRQSDIWDKTYSTGLELPLPLVLYVQYF